MTERQVASAARDVKWIYEFAEGSAAMRDLLGGKGANLAELTGILGVDRVPPGFTVTTEACAAYMGQDRQFPAGLEEQLDEAVARLEAAVGRSLGDADDPLLVSVRSGARQSMPGMLDTVLNLGLNDKAVAGLARRTGDERFAWDCYRRLVQMYGIVVPRVPSEQFESRISTMKAELGVEDDSSLHASAVKELTRRFRQLYAFPEEPREQLRGAVRAVFDSWTALRATEYRRIHRIPDEWGTAVNVQQMVFGNRGSRSGSGVAFSRDETTGAPKPSGEFLENAQGEDVVSGFRTPLDLDELGRRQPAVHSQLLEILRLLERHYGDMQDIEFTVDAGHLFILQARAAKRPGAAAVRFAVDAEAEGLLPRDAALLTVDPEALDGLLHRRFDPDASYSVAARGIAASPGAAIGSLAFSSARAVEWARGGRDVILARPFTDAEDVAGFHAARGVLTSDGGKASHAALVARGMGRPAVTGAGEVRIDPRARTVRIGKNTLREGDPVAINGTTGEITLDRVELVEPEPSSHLERVLEWADHVADIEVRANADTPATAEKALALGAAGIGLCRTEHMLLGDRQSYVAEVVLAEDEQTRTAAIERLRPLQEQDFAEMLEAVRGRPVCVRLLDPPLHEFLSRPEDLPRGSAERGRVEALQEQNPMLGTRGVRLGILMPELYEMQVRALVGAAGKVPGSCLEVMVPFVGFAGELQFARRLVERAAAAQGAGEVSLGTMIELPRACLVADEIARFADFFSFGTNDLTQTTLGFSRDDVEAQILSRYQDSGVFAVSPFETLDTEGVGEMIRTAAARGRSANGRLELGVCGEHGGDPESIEQFRELGIDYVSCSPLRVPVAQLAAAHAAVRLERA